MKHFFWILLFLTLPLAGCQEKKGVVLATVGGENITQAELDLKLSNVPQELREAANARKKEFVEDMVAEELLLQEAKKRGIGEEADVKALVQEANKKILVAKLIETEIDKKIAFDPSESLKYYEANKEEFKAPLLLRASHILLKTEEEARSIKSQLDLGADFEELARAKSTDTTAKRGGDLGFFQQGQLVPEFEQAVLKMKKGEIAGPVKTNFGFHLIKLTDRIEPAIRDFESVRRLIEERLMAVRRKQALKVLVDGLKSKSSVTLNEKALS